MIDKDILRVLVDVVLRMSTHVPMDKRSIRVGLNYKRSKDYKRLVYPIFHQGVGLNVQTRKNYQTESVNLKRILNE